MPTKKIFVIPTLKEEKIGLLLSLITVALFPITAVIITLVGGDDIAMLGKLLLMFFLPFYIVMIIVGLNSLEWYNVYDDRIEARGVYKIKNTVYFKDILYVEKTAIPVFTRGKAKEFYIFNDGRKNNNSIINYNSPHNKSKFNLRIYKTPLIDEYISVKGFVIK